MKKIIGLSFLCILIPSLAFAQAWQVPANTIPYGKGPGQANFGSVANTGSGTLCLLNTVPPSFGTCSGSLPTLLSGRLFVGNSSNVATSVPLSGDCTLVASGAITCTKTNGSAFTALATSTDAVNLTGTVANARLAGTGATTVNSQTCTLGSTCTVTAAASSATVGTTIIGSGTTTRILFDNSGVLGEYSISGTGNVAMTTSPVFTTPNIGTPSAGVVTNLTGTASININGTVGATTPATVSATTGSFHTGTDSNLEIIPHVSSSTGISLRSINDAANTYKDAEILSNNLILNAAGGTGNVGIGTTIPTYNLDIAANQNNTNSARISNTSAGAAASAIVTADNGTNKGYFGVRGTGSTNSGVLVANDGQLAADQGIGIVALGGPIKFASSGTAEQMRLDTTGRFGIGTTSPSAQLHTTGTVRFGGISGVGTGGCLGNDTSGNITGGNPCSGTGFPSGGVKGDIPYYSAANTGAATPASDANIVIQGGDPSGVGSSTAAAALAYAYSKRVVLPPAPGGTTGTYKFSTDVTFPSGTELIIPCGVTLAPDSGKFVRNLGVTKAGYCTIVSGAGVVSLGRDVKADWWPSTGGDDTIAINAADRSTNNASALSFTGSISTTTLTVTAVASGYITLGKPITGAGVTANTIVTALGTGTGEVGTYTVSISQTVGSEAMTGDSADGSENIIRLSCRTYTIATAIILHANLANPQKLTGCGPKTTTLSVSGGSFSRGALTQAGMTAGVGNDLMQFTWRDFGVTCSADQNIQGITLGTTTKAIRSYGKNVIERVGVFDCRVGIGWYNTRLVDLIDMWINVHGETTAAATAIQMDFDDNSQFNGDSDIVRGQFACNLTSPSGGAGYGLRFKSEHSGGNIAGIRVHGSVFYYCNKMVYGTWVSTGTMGDHWFTDGIQCETCGNLADYSGSTGSKKAAMLRFDNIYLTGTVGQPLFRFAGGNADEIVDILVHNIRARGGGGCSTCRFASFEYASNATVTGNQIISFEGTGGNPNELINLTAARKAMIANNIGDPDGIGGSVPFLVTAGTSSIDVSVVNNTARQAVTATWNASSVTNVCVANNLPTAASGC